MAPLLSMVAVSLVGLSHGEGSQSFCENKTCNHPDTAGTVFLQRDTSVLKFPALAVSRRTDSGTRLGDAELRSNRFRVGDMYAGCQKTPSLWRNSLGADGQTLHGDAAARGTLNNTYDRSKASCSAGEIVVRHFGAENIDETCCTASSLACAGCAVASGAACTTCAGGFSKRKETCVSCADSAGWLDAEGSTCFDIKKSECSDVRVRGESSNEACCKCGGGRVTGTPFTYDKKHWAVGSNIHIFPEPRTAQRYSVDATCALAAHNLTLDGSTGVISVTPGFAPPSNALWVECEITAHQTPLVSFTAKAVIVVEYFTYSVPLFVVPGESELELAPVKADGEWKDFSVNCVPKTSWLTINSVSGLLTRAAKTHRGSGSLSLDSDPYTGQTGGGCVVTGLFKGPASTTFEKKRTKLITVWPNPQQVLSYGVTSVSVTVGERVPILHPTQPIDFAVLKPWSFAVSCLPVDNSDVQFVFDRSLGVGMVSGHPLLEISKDGALSIAPAQSFSFIFDRQSARAGEHQSIAMSCSIWGMFPDPALPSIRAKLSIKILDNMCWVDQQITGHRLQVQKVDNGAGCRRNCRNRKTCAFFNWQEGACYTYHLDPRGTKMQAFAKISNCTAQTACQRLSGLTWDQTGDYCPVGSDILRNSAVYQKVGATKAENFYLATHSSTYDGAIKGCNDGDWIVRRPAPSVDVINVERGYYELRGKTAACIPKTDDSISLTPSDCPAPAVVNLVENGLQPLVIDDPTTPQPADHWLHPCDCAPPAWGAELPLDPQSLEQIPPESRNTFLPPAFPIVSGQFVCPVRFLLGDVHFGTAEEPMDGPGCETLCRDHVDCAFFWHGTQAGDNACRLYVACAYLVREAGASGHLVALPREKSCHVANPELCWSTSMRRESLLSSSTMPFLYWHLHQQCDEALLLGGSGIDSCARPTYRVPESHPWAHKAPLPKTFPHGKMLAVSCWAERFSGISGAHQAEKETLTCVNGDWFNSVNEPGLGSFACVACVQASGPGYSEYVHKNEQELYFFNRMKLSLFTETAIGLTQAKVNCLEALAGEEVSLIEKTTCSPVLVARFNGIPGSNDREFRFLSGKGDSCLEGFLANEVPSVARRACNDSLPSQHISVAELPMTLWRLHEVQAEAMNKRFAPGSYDCGAANSAISNIHFAHLFKVVPQQAASYVGGLTLKNFYVDHHAAGWKDVDKHVKIAFDSFPAATKIRICAAFWDRGAVNGNFKVALIRPATGGSHQVNYYVESFGRSGVSSVVSKCGRWASVSHMECGRSWGNSCRLQFYHNVNDILSVEGLVLEFGSDDPDLVVGLGRVDVINKRIEGPVNTKDWQDLGSSVHFVKSDYPEATHIRLCVGFSDWATKSDDSFRIRLLGKSSQLLFEDDYGFTWSNGGLQHNKCGPWHDLKTITCGRSWGDTCRFQWRSGSTRIKIEHVEFELKGSGESAHQYLGSTDFAIDDKQVTTPVDRIGPYTIGVTEHDYPAATEFRVCALLADSGRKRLRIRLVKADGDVLTDDFFGGTNSHARLFHHKCGDWRTKLLLQCGKAPKDACRIDLLQEPGVNVRVKQIQLEYRLNGRDQACRFSPILKRMPGTTPRISDGETKTWYEMLADVPVSCPAGSVFTSFRYKSHALSYTCGVVPGVGACVEWFSTQVETGTWSRFDVFKRMSIGCDTDAFISGFQFEFSKGGNWARFKYRCCKALGVPMGLTPHGLDGVPLLDGRYCPVSQDASGRFRYARLSASDAAGGTTGDEALQLMFKDGKWCIRDQCSKIYPNADPAGVKTSSFEIVAISDFAGEFEGTGVPQLSTGENVDDLVKKKSRRFKNILPSVAHVQPKMPELQGFEPEMPSYSAECMGYSDLWNKIRESYYNAAGDFEEHDATLTEVESDGLSEGVHPCEVAAGAGGVKGILGGGDSSDTPGKMGYDEIFECSTRDINRDLRKADMEASKEMFGLITDLVGKGIEMICEVIPDIEIAPVGFGVQINPSDICTSIKNLVDAGVKLATPAVGFGSIILNWELDKEGVADCNPLQVGLSRLFCDIHCVRDAVIRGDRTIIRNLKAATDATTNNMKQLTEWSVDLATKGTDRLSKKIEQMDEKLSTDLTAINEHLLGSKGKNLFEAVNDATRSMLQEMEGYARAASFDPVAKLTAREALAKFAQNANILSGNANETLAFASLHQVGKLHSILRNAGSGSKAEIVGKQLRYEIVRLQQAAREQIKTIGIYRWHSNVSKRTVRNWENMLQRLEMRSVLLPLDQLWWRIRSSLDDHIDMANDEMGALQEAFVALTAYESCANGFESLVSTYSASLAARTRAHEHLKRTWRKSSHQLGELASTIADGSVFETFVRGEGCGSTLAEQTMQQSRFAVGSMQFLVHRFQVAGLSEPDVSVLVDAARRIEQSYKAARSRCV